jgi:uncharacterized protein (UPF0332 family)
VNDEADRRLAKARRLLDQIVRLDAAAVPEPAIHGAYYAMFHAATAALIAREGAAPATHSALIGRFSQLARSEGATARDHGRALNRAFDLRLAADYGAEPAGLADVAPDIVRDAEAFVRFCARLCGNRE